MGCTCSKEKVASLEEEYPKFAVPPKPAPTTPSPDIVTTPPPEEEVGPEASGSSSSEGSRPENRPEDRLGVIPGGVRASPTPEASPSPSARLRPANANVDYDQFRKMVQEENYNLLKEDFSNPQVFLSSQILMSVQFFQNFERDRYSWRNTKFDTEEEMNAKLAGSGRKALVHDSVYQKIQECVGFKSKENPSVLEPLLPTEYYICYECIHTSRAEDLDDDELARHRTVEPGSYHLCAEKSANTGFRKLRCLNPTLAHFKERRSIHLEPEPVFNQRPESPRPDPKPMPQATTIANGNGPAKDNEDDEEDEDTFEDGLQETGKEFMEKLKFRIDKNSPVSRPKSSPPRNKKILDFKPQESMIFKKPISENGLTRENNNNVRDKRTDNPGSDAQTYSLEEDAYGFIVSRPVKLSDVRHDFNPRRESLLPSKCFQKFQPKPTSNDLLDPYSSPGSETPAAQLYFSSKQFMAFFASTFDELASALGKRSLLGSARSQDPRIMCREDIPGSSPMTKESRVHFIPSVEACFWPDEASEFTGASLISRRRPRVRDNRTGMTYQWPPKDVLATLERTGFNLVPVGFVPARAGADHDKTAAEEQTLQWLVTFTKVEQLIQRTLNHPKLRCYLFALLLYKTFMNGDDASDSLNHTHIRYMFYYMIENEPIGWVDERLGVNLIHYLKKMKGCLKSERFAHYFIAKQNMFAHIPKHKLRKAQERFTRIQENVVPHLMVAIKRLHYDDGFYPFPDMDKLYVILTAADSLKMIMDPEFLGKSDSSRETDRAPRSHRSADPSVERMREQHRRAAAAAERRAPNGAECEKETIAVDAPLADWDDNRRRLVLEFFIAHFVAMTRRSNEFRNYGQGLMYLMQAENLFRLLVECKFEGTRAHLEMRDEIEQLKQVSHASAKDYWNIAWGWEERPAAGSQAAAQHNGVRPATEAAAHRTAQVRFG